MKNKYTIEANKKAQRVKDENKACGKHCLKCQKTLSYIAFSLSSLCRECEQEIKKQKI